MMNAIIHIIDKSLKEKFLNYIQTAAGSDKYISMHDKAPKYSTAMHGIMYKDAGSVKEILDGIFEFYVSNSVSGHFYIALSRDEQIQIPSDADANQVMEKMNQLQNLDFLTILLTVDPPRNGKSGIRLVRNSESRGSADTGNRTIGTREDIVKTVKALEKPSIRIIPHKENAIPDYSPLISHFGGHPYFEEGEDWPHGKDGKPLAFIFQFIVTEEMDLPDEYTLVQFYYSWEKQPWNPDDEGWLVKTYKEINKDNIRIIETPYTKGVTNFCTITYEGTRTLPPLDYFSMYDRDMAKLIDHLSGHSEYRSSYGYYSAIRTEIIGKHSSYSRIGGYADWIQGGAAFMDSEGKPMKLLFQLDSERWPDIMFGDAGSVYVFYGEKDPSKLKFCLQSG